MVTIKVLKRKDASSVIVAVALALIGYNTIGALTSKLAETLSGLGDRIGTSSDWKVNYLLPLVSIILQLIALEVFLRFIIFVREGYVRAGRK